LRGFVFENLKSGILSGLEEADGCALVVKEGFLLFAFLRVGAGAGAGAGDEDCFIVDSFGGGGAFFLTDAADVADADSDLHEAWGR
jgi:hypothetical protein